MNIEHRKSSETFSKTPGPAAESRKSGEGKESVVEKYAVEKSPSEEAKEWAEVFLQRIFSYGEPDFRNILHVLEAKVSDLEREAAKLRRKLESERIRAEGSAQKGRQGVYAGAVKNLAELDEQVRLIDDRASALRAVYLRENGRIEESLFGGEQRG